MKLIIALGNPGKEFEKTRHNVGFLALDAFVKSKKLPELTNFKKADCLMYKERNFILIKPLSFMNNSGICALKIVKFFKIKLENVVVLYDDINLPIGRVRSRLKGSNGGHNGIKNIIKHLGSEKIKRIRIGVDNDMDIPLSKWVLSPFEKKELIELEEVFEKVNDVLNLFLKGDFYSAMNKYN